MSLADRLRNALAEGHASGDALTRGFARTDIPEHELVPAAVLLAITDRPEPGIILTQRTSSLRKHSGQVALPGGRVDPGDGTVVQAALREAQEEIGLSPQYVDIVGETDPLMTGSDYLITPVVGIIPPDLPFELQPQEVESVFEVPMMHLLEESNHIWKSVEYQGSERHFTELLWNEYRIWGVTGEIIRNFAYRLKGRF